jgi:hypothetical protein
MKRQPVWLALLLSAALFPFVLQAQPGTSNAITQENQKAGTTEWLLFNHDQVVPGRDDVWRRETGVEGYCSHATIRAGETLTIFVSTDPARPFRIDFYRMGYYGGKGGRHMLGTETFAGETQPTPTDGEEALIECKWNPSFQLKIPGDWLSGVYLGKLQVAEPRAEAYVVFVVRDDRQADFLFQCSDMTWQSYNRWPAFRSLYDYRENRWHTAPGNDVGFDRPYSIYLNWLPAPFAPITNGSGEFLLWEFPLAFWMEKEGYDVSYISNIDTHVDRKGLLRAKGWLSVGHDEYWTQQMYDNVSYARDQGVSLAFLSGNSVSGIVYLNPSTSGVPNRVFGRLRRFGRAAAQLMGASSHGTGMGDWTVENADHWLFRGTGMKKGDSIPKLIGWEYHGQPNGDQPGLTVLATSFTRNRDNQELRTRNAHTSTIYELAKGNIVFDAGTCWWNMVLSCPPGFVNPPRRDFTQGDERVRQITSNLFTRMIAGKRADAGSQ